MNATSSFDARRTPNLEATAGGDATVVITFRGGTVYTLTGVRGGELAAFKAFRGAWHAGKTGGVDLDVIIDGQPARLQFDYENVTNVEITEPH